MREIKFRCWYDKRMHKVVDIDFSYKRINLLGADIISFEQGILMQYTGLKDKNGKEIYEGDILQLADTKMEVFWGEHIGIGYGFCWRNIKGKNEYHESITGFIDEYEVIGNIHDNPELLKESE